MPNSVSATNNKYPLLEEFQWRDPEQGKTAVSKGLQTYNFAVEQFRSRENQVKELEETHQTQSSLITNKNGKRALWVVAVALFIAFNVTGFSLATLGVALIALAVIGIIAVVNKWEQNKLKTKQAPELTEEVAKLKVQDRVVLEAAQQAFNALTTAPVGTSTHIYPASNDFAIHRKNVTVLQDLIQSLAQEKQ